MSPDVTLHVRPFVNTVELILRKRPRGERSKAVGYILSPDQLDAINALAKPWAELDHLVSLMETWFEEPRFSYLCRKSLEAG